MSILAVPLRDRLLFRHYHHHIDVGRIFAVVLYIIFRCLRLRGST